MTDPIQRWTADGYSTEWGEMRPAPAGAYVLAADAEAHEAAAVAAAEQREYDRGRADLRDDVTGASQRGYEQGQRDGRLAQSAAEMDAAVINQNVAYDKGYEQGLRDERARIRAGQERIEGGYSVPVGMPVGAFIDAMRQAFLAVIDAAPQHVRGCLAEDGFKCLCEFVAAPQDER